MPNQQPRRLFGSGQTSLRAFLLVAVAVAIAIATPVMAATYTSVRYDPKGDQLIVTMIYDGTNSNHRFSVKWGSCMKLDEPGAPAHQIDAGILDDQGNDATDKTYRKTIKVPLANLSCRPSRVTLWTEPFAPWNKRTLDIP